MRILRKFGRRPAELHMKVCVIHGDYPKNDLSAIGTGVWDTGADITAVDHSLAESIGLRRLDIPPRHVRTGGGIILAYFYEACIQLAPDTQPIHMIVSEIFNSDVAVLIGMDIINKGEFLLTQVNGEALLDFFAPDEALASLAPPHTDTIQ